MLIENPILRGLIPTSIIRVEKVAYIATSTFEWFPGVQLHHSKDLVRWGSRSNPSQKSQLDLLGVPDSCGVWAPCLSSKDGVSIWFIPMLNPLQGYGKTPLIIW